MALTRTTPVHLKNINLALFTLIHSIEMSELSTPEDQVMLDTLRTRLAERLAPCIDKKTFIVKNTGGMRYYPNGTCTVVCKGWSEFLTDEKGNVAILLSPYTVEKVDEKVLTARKATAITRFINNTSCVAAAGCSVTNNKKVIPSKDVVAYDLKDLTVDTLHAAVCSASSIITKGINLSSGTKNIELSDVLTEPFTRESRFLKSLLSIAQQSPRDKLLLRAAQSIDIEISYTGSFGRRVGFNNISFPTFGEYRDFIMKDIEKYSEAYTNYCTLEKEFKLLGIDATNITATFLKRRLETFIDMFEPISLLYNNHRYQIHKVDNFSTKKRFPLNYSIPIWTDEASAYIQTRASALYEIRESSKKMYELKKTIDDVILHLETRDITIHFGEEVEKPIDVLDMNCENSSDAKENGWIITKESLNEVKDVFSSSKHMKAIGHALSGMIF